MNRKATLFKMLSVLVVFGVLATACAAPTTPATSPTEAPAESTSAPAPEGKQFDGVTVNLLTFVGPQVAEPLQRRAPDFTALTGATINIITVPNSDLYQKALTDMATGTKAYDAFLFAPSWIVDFAPAGYIEDLTSRVNADTALQWDDVAPFFRDFNSYNGKVYSIPLDGDMHMVYYRIDSLAAAGLEPPKTWDDYLNVAKTLNGTDLNGDGEADYGSCISKAPHQQSYWWIWSIAAPYIQSQGNTQGTFFNTADMTPLVNNDGFKRALEVYKETGLYGPPDELNQNVGDSRGLFISGRCALTMDWGDIGTLAIAEGSKVVDKVGAVVTPGSTEVLDWATGELVACDATTCPFAVDGVNHAPYASFGGWAGAVSAAADPEVKDAAYAFISYMSQPAQSNADVTVGSTGYNPFRISQFQNKDAWLAAGFSEAAADSYLGGIENSLNSPNMVADLRIPQNQRYIQVELDRIIAEYAAGQLTTDEAAQQIYDAWEAITDELGRDAQLASYKATIGAK
ncbi:MAG TPA: extracellular solute-binding protein [Anaerolineales bacterium]|jgi:multiple sugar transport system substrate-binding protein